VSDDLQARKQTLSRTPFFGGLEDAALARVISMLVPRSLARGEVVFREGDLGRSLYIISVGTLVASSAGESGHNVRLVRLGPGDFIGEMALVEVHPHSMTVTAETAAQVLELTNRDLYRLYMEDVQAYVMVLQNIARELCRRLRGAAGRIVEIADETGDEVTQIRSASAFAKMLDGE
jgi:CRP-like cAMP-binding protein